MIVHVHEYLDNRRVHYCFYDVVKVDFNNSAVLICQATREEFTFNLDKCHVRICNS